jgi:hypothetical protein
MFLRSFHWRVRLFVLLALIAVGTVLFLPPIADSPEYHHFADHRSFLGIPNFLNVVSNVPFLLVGLLGLLFLIRIESTISDGAPATGWEGFTFGVLFATVGLTALGSAYYHLHPNSATLFWDRLPMTIVFMSVFGIMIGERISLRVGRWLFLPLLATGVGSIVYWRYTETYSAGDLRFYGLVQFFPLVAIPLLVILFPPIYTRSADWIVMGAWYILSKIFELLDRLIFAVGGMVSGHTLKHLAAVMSTFWIFRMVSARRRISD